MSFPDPGIRARPFCRRLLRAVEIFAPKLNQRQRQIVLVVVRIARDRRAKNVYRLRRVAKMRLNIPEQRKIRIVLLARGRNCLRRRERILRIFLSGNTRLPGRISRHRNPDSRAAHSENAGSRRRTYESALAARQFRSACDSRSAYSIELLDRFPSIGRVAQLQVSFRQQIQVLRLPGMLLDLLVQFGDIKLRPRLRRKRGTVVEIIEQMLIGIWPGRRILRQRLKYIQISFVPRPSDEDSAPPSPACSSRRRDRG